MGETMNREQAAAKLVAMMYVEPGAHRVVPKEQARLLAGGMVFDKAVDLILEVDALRAQLSERDREIERLKAEVEARINTTGERCDQIRKAIGAVECLAWGLVVEQVTSLQAQFSASQAREREAVTALAEAREALAIVQKRWFLECEESNRLESALAAARKALEELVSAMRKSSDRKFQPDDAETHWLVEPPMTDEEYDIYHAALNGDSHAE